MYWFLLSVELIQQPSAHTLSSFGPTKPFVMVYTEDEISLNAAKLRFLKTSFPKQTNKSRCIIFALCDNTNPKICGSCYASCCNLKGLVHHRTCSVKYKICVPMSDVCTNTTSSKGKKRHLFNVLVKYFPWWNSDIYL